jgi:phosphatidylinositol alpha-mannosyltransferase
MKIALVSPYDYAVPGGVNKHISHLDIEFRRLGHEVRIIAPSSAGRDELTDNLYTVGGVVPFPISGSKVRITLSPRAYRRVKTILKAEQFDLIHLHEPMMPALPLYVLRHSHTVNVGTFHAYRESHPGYSYGKPLVKRFWNRLHGRICVSPAALETVSRYFPGDYAIIPNGIDMPSFSSATPLADYVGGPNVLFVGRMEPRKGLRYLLQAFPYVKQEFPTARLLVVGGYSEEDVESYRRYIRRHGIADVIFVGYVSEQDLPRYYRTADVFCAPSTGFESFGIILLEAMAVGRATVASDIPGYREVLTHGEEGLLVPPANERALATAIVHLLADGERRAAMGQRGQATAAQYDWSKVAARVLDYYQETIYKVQRRAHLRQVLVKK